MAMAEEQIRFNDGAAYERMMGDWSRRVGEIFLDWLAPSPGLRWIDIGCGNGAFTALLAERCAPAAITGIDPSEAQLAFACTRPGTGGAEFRQGNAMALPFADNSFDAASMALVIFFVPEPAKGIAEMARVVRPGGTLATYAWDLPGGGFPLEPVHAELRVMGIQPMLPPSPDASRIDVMRDLWTGAGLEAVETRAITVQRRFADFDEFWAINVMAPSFAATMATITSSDVAALKARLRARLTPDATGGITSMARANAVKGRLPN